jgi:hypothetical protein
MRSAISLILTCILAVAASAAPMASGKVTLDVKDADIAAVIKTLFDQSGKSYDIGPDVKGSVTSHLEDVTLDQALRIVLLPRGFTWKVVDGAYLLSKKKEPPIPELGKDAVPPIGEPETPRQPDANGMVLEKIPLKFLDARELISFIQGQPKLADSLRQQGIAGMFPLQSGLGLIGGNRPGTNGYWNSPPDTSQMIGSPSNNLPTQPQQKPSILQPWQR